METLQILICEDDHNEKERLISYISNCSVPTQCTYYASGEALLKEYVIGKYDLILMDIIMSGMTGVETVRQIRLQDPNVFIAFVTSSTEYTLESYRLEVFRYLEKPIRQDAIAKLLHFVQMTQRTQPQFCLPTGERLCAFDHIVYLEQMGHKVYLYLRDDRILQINKKLDDIQSFFDKNLFFRCHKSYLVNLAYVTSLDSELKQFIMLNRSHVYIRRESMKDAKEKYENYLFQKTREDFDR